MSLTPMILTNQKEIKRSTIIFFSSYVIMSKASHRIGLTNVTDQYNKLDPLFFIFSTLSFLALFAVISVYKKVHKSNKRISWLMVITRFLFNQSKLRIY